MGPRDRAIDSISAALGRAGDRALVLTVLGLMSVLAGCSSFSSPSSTGTSPATYQPAAAAAPAAIIRPSNNALREAFIPYSFLMLIDPTSNDRTLGAQTRYSYRPLTTRACL